MIPRDFITEWRQHASWTEDSQVEQDLIICRALVEIFSVDATARTLAFRGGTALHKLHLPPAARYSEDIDLVQMAAGPIGPSTETSCWGRSCGRCTNEKRGETCSISGRRRLMGRWIRLESSSASSSTWARVGCASHGPSSRRISRRSFLTRPSHRMLCHFSDRASRGTWKTRPVTSDRRCSPACRVARGEGRDPNRDAPEHQGSRALPRGPRMW